jgi:phosphohistidine phosphatase
MRHGDAEPIQRNDKARKLTTLGEKQAANAGHWLAKYTRNTNGIDVALVSPYVRAVQTYEQLIKHVNVTTNETNEDIIPSGDSAMTHDYIDAMLSTNKIKSSLLIVSHMPFVSYLLDELLSNKISLLFATTSMAVIDYSIEKSSGELIEIYHPI